MVTPAQFLAEARFRDVFGPEAGGMSEEQIQTELSLATQKTALNTWGDLQDEAIKLKTAHNLFLSLHQQGAAQKIANSLAEGGEFPELPSRLEKGQDFYSKTIYGIQFMNLSKQVLQGSIGMVAGTSIHHRVLDGY